MIIKTKDFPFNMYNHSNSTIYETITVPKHSNIIDISILNIPKLPGVNKVLKVSYIIDNINIETDTKVVFLNFVKIQEYVNISQPMDGFEFFKTIETYEIVFDNGKSLQEFLTNKYLVFINRNLTIDEIRENKLNDIIN